MKIVKTIFDRISFDAGVVDEFVLHVVRPKRGLTDLNETRLHLFDARRRLILYFFVCSTIMLV